MEENSWEFWEASPLLGPKGVWRFGVASDAWQKGANYLQKYLKARLIHNKVSDIFPSSSAITPLPKKTSTHVSMFFSYYVHIMCYCSTCNVPAPIPSIQSRPLLLGIDDGHQVVASQITSGCQTREATTNNQHTTPWPTNKLYVSNWWKKPRTEYMKSQKHRITSVKTTCFCLKQNLS